MTVFVCGGKDRSPSDAVVINTTSRSKNWSRGLSPFLCGPCDLYVREGRQLISKNVENAWQFSKVYPEYGNEDGPLPSYWDWAQSGWSDSFAHRYPMGKGVLPLYSWWDGRRMDYLTARKEVYLPLYRQAVVRTEAWKTLKDLSAEIPELWLWDFDGYDHKKLGMSFHDVLDCPERKMGHAFILAGLLEGDLDEG